MQKRYLLCAFFLSILLSSCAAKRMTTHLIGAIAWDGQSAVEDEKEVELVRSSFFPLIKSLEVLKAGSPSDRRYLLLLGRSYCQYGFGFLEEDMLRLKGNDEKGYNAAVLSAKNFYNRGNDYVIAALKTKGRWKNGLDVSHPEFERSLKGASRGDLPILFWTSFCLGNSINLNKDDVKAVIAFPKVESMVKKVVELEPVYQHGSAQAFLGVMASSRSGMLGGNLEDAKKYFENAIKFGDKYLFNKVLYAQYYAVATQDIKLYERLLNEVIEAPDDVLPAQNLSNALAKRRAKILLERKKDYF